MGGLGKKTSSMVSISLEERRITDPALFCSMEFWAKLESGGEDNGMVSGVCVTGSMSLESIRSTCVLILGMM